MYQTRRSPSCWAFRAGSQSSQAGRGIGRACCIRLAEAGAAVVVADLDEEAARKTAAAIGPRATGAALDVRNAASVRTLVERTLNRQRQIDVWVNAAGVYPTSPLLDLSDEEWDLVLDTNLRGTFFGAREAARAMAARDAGGVIVNVSSTAAYRAEAPGAAHYVASKFGVRGLTQALAVELGPHGIRVLGVAPTVTSLPASRRRGRRSRLPDLRSTSSGRASRSGVSRSPTTSPGWSCSARAISRC